MSTTSQHRRRSIGPGPCAVVGWLGSLAVVTILGDFVASAQITIPTVTIGSPGNAPDPTTGGLYGSVAYTYNIGRTEVTNAQYAAFLNAKAASDTWSLYDTNMAGFFGGITRSGSPGSYTYSTSPGRENNPVIYVTYWSAARFANWLHNGQGNGDTETGAYTLTPSGISANTISRNAGWQWAVTSENEWYKAAYFQSASAGGDADGYWLYPTSSNFAPTSAQANISGSGIYNTTPVGSYAANFRGTFDMGGNVWEWNEAIIGGSSRCLRGGGYGSVEDGLRAGYRASFEPGSQIEDLGFRVSQASGLSCPCAADFDQSGGTPDAADIDAFFTAWLNGDASADADCSGGTPDSSDIDMFFAQWLAGGC